MIMTEYNWAVHIIGQAEKVGKALSKSAAKSYLFLLTELEELGPYRSDWPNYSKMKGLEDNYHCHIEKGRPAYVACWRIINKKQKILEV